MRDLIENKIPVCVATDKNFVVLVAALVKSVEVNNNPERFKVFVFGDSLDERDKLKLKESTCIELEVFDFPKALYRFAPKSMGHLPKVAYIRLFIPELLKDYDKLIYLDVDMLVLGNLQDLWNIPLDGHVVLASLNLNMKRLGDQGTGIYNFEKLQIDPEAPHFNSGMMVIDNIKWIEGGVKEKVVGILENQLKNEHMMDQAGLNVVLYKKWKKVDKRWNYPPHITDMADPPNIIHFNGRKPIYYDYRGKHQDLFFYYLKMTAWKDTKKYGIIKKLMIKAPTLIPLLLWKLSRLLGFKS